MIDTHAHSGWIIIDWTDLWANPVSTNIWYKCQNVCYVMDFELGLDRISLKVGLENQGQSWEFTCECQ